MIEKPNILKKISRGAIKSKGTKHNSQFRMMSPMSEGGEP
jgi:hypothetical protein